MANNEDVYYHFVCLPKGVNGITVVNPDNTYEVYINSNLCIKRQKEAVKHELKHIGYNHFHICETINAIEFKAIN